MAEWADWVWLNGKLVVATEASVSVFDRSFLLGDGVFETMRARGGRIFRRERHLDRLARGAAQLRLSLPYTTGELDAGIDAALSANHLTDGAVRLTLSRGAGPPGLAISGADQPTCVIAARPFSGYPDRWYDPGASALISSVTKNERSPLAGLKSTSFAEHVLARLEAAEQGVDEALLLNTRGHLVEGSATNLFAVVEGSVYTPDLASGCLPGITRETVLEIARRIGLQVREAPLLPGLKGGWQEAFLTNSLLGVAPLVHLEDAAVGTGQPGPLTTRLKQRYLELCASETAGG